MSCDVRKETERLENEQSSFSNLSITSPTSELILQPFHCFTYVTAHSPTILLLHQCHSSFSNPSVALPTSQLILQPFCCFTNVTAHSQTLLSLLLHHRLFTYVTWRAAPVMNIVLSFFVIAQGKYLRPFLYLQWHSRKQQILPHPPTPFKYFHGKILLTRQTD